MPAMPKLRSPPRDASPAWAAACPTVTIEPRRRSEKVGSWVDPSSGEGAAAASGAVRKPRREGPEALWEGDRGQGPGRFPARLTLTLAAPAWVQIMLPSARRLEPAGARALHRHRAPGTHWWDPGDNRLSPRSAGCRESSRSGCHGGAARGGSGSVRARRGPAGSETHRVAAPTSAPAERQRSALHRFILPPASLPPCLLLCGYQAPEPTTSRARSH